jgi:hypothetical protein
MWYLLPNKPPQTQNVLVGLCTLLFLYYKYSFLSHPDKPPICQRWWALTMWGSICHVLFWVGLCHDLSQSLSNPRVELAIIPNLPIKAKSFSSSIYYLCIRATVIILHLKTLSGGKDNKAEFNRIGPCFLKTY